MSSNSKIEEEDRQISSHFTNLYSQTPVKMEELDLLDVKKMVNKRCIDNGIFPPVKLYGFENGCPVCNTDYTSENWVVLHPCGHLLCNSCLNGIINITIQNKSVRRCPLCRNSSKWIMADKDNFKNTNTIPSKFQIDDDDDDTTSNFSTYRNFQYTPSPVSRRRFNNDIFIKSKPPLKVERKEREEKEEKIRCEFSKKEIQKINSHNEVKTKILGNLSIIGSEINMEDNTGIDLVIVFDVSGSMSNVANEGMKILKHAVDSLGSIDRLCIIVFDNDARQLFPLQPMVSNIKEECKDKISRCFSGGSTNLESAISLLIRVKEDGMQRERPFKVILLSDGHPDSGCEGFNLTPTLYQGNIHPEVYSCTFGDNVKADVMKRFLLSQNQHNYKHISDMGEFKDLVKGIGLDKNIIIGTNLLINFTGIKAYTELIKKNELNHNETYLLINQIKSGDVINIPILLEYEDDTKSNFKVQYVSLNGVNINVEIERVDCLNDFIIHHYYYKKALKYIKNIVKLNSKDEKIAKLLDLKNRLNNEKYGDFIEEIEDLIVKTRAMIENVENNYRSYNTYSSQVENLSSFCSPVISTAYKSASSRIKNKST